MQTMLMSHTTATQVVHVEYRFKLVTGRPLTDVKPLWLRANGCRSSSYDIGGGAGEGADHVRAHDWRMPFDGRIVAAGAHLHGSAKDMTISQPRCDDRTVIRHAPRYGNPNDLVYRLRPVLHEPGPIATGYFLSRTGIAVRRGEPLRVTGVYDASRPHPGVMSITHVYVARDPAVRRAARCAPLPADRRTYWTRRDGRAQPPVVRLPLYGLDDRGKVVEIDRPRGREVVEGDRAEVVARDTFRPANLSVGLGAEVTWRFPERHNVLLAEGPRTVASGTRTGGDRWTKRFDTPGEYRMFCWLHPVTMQQVLRVRDRPAGA
jgi:plastocyanin